MRYKDWYGKYLKDYAAEGESGYVLEAHLFGGILFWRRRTRQRHTRSTTRFITLRGARSGHWSEPDIQELCIRRGGVGEKEVFIIGKFV